MPLLFTSPTTQSVPPQSWYGTNSKHVLKKEAEADIRQNEQQLEQSSMMNAKTKLERPPCLTEPKFKVPGRPHAYGKDPVLEIFSFEQYFGLNGSLEHMTPLELELRHPLLYSHIYARSRVNAIMSIQSYCVYFDHSNVYLHLLVPADPYPLASEIHLVRSQRQHHGFQGRLSREDLYCYFLVGLIPQHRWNNPQDYRFRFEFEDIQSNLQEPNVIVLRRPQHSSDLKYRLDTFALSLNTRNPFSERYDDNERIDER